MGRNERVAPFIDKRLRVGRVSSPPAPRPAPVIQDTMARKKPKKPKKLGDADWQRTIPLAAEFRSRSAGFERVRSGRTTTRR